MTARTILVTGASRGVGRALAGQLADQGHRLVLVARPSGELAAARAEIAARARGAEVAALGADLSSMQQVRELCVELRRRWSTLDTIVFNHGAVFPKREVTSEGLERNLAVNFLSSALMAESLLGMLSRSTRGRVVLISAEAHRRVHMDLEALDGAGAYHSVDAYCRAKLAALIRFRDLADQPRACCVDWLATHPGSIDTGALGVMRAEFTRLTGCTTYPEAVSPGKGAVPLTKLVLGKEFEGLGWGYFVVDRPAEPAPAVDDHGLRERLRQCVDRWLETALA